MSENENTHDDKLEFLHQDPNVTTRFLFLLLITGVSIFFLIRFSSFMGWPLFIGFVVGASQKIHIIDRNSMTVSNYFGIGFRFNDLWSRLFLINKDAIDGKKSVHVKSENRFWETEHASGREKVYHVRIKCESGDVVLSTFKSRSTAQKKSAEIKRFLKLE